MRWIWEFMAWGEFIQSPNSNRDIDLNHFFDFWMFALILVVSQLKRARTKKHRELMKRLLWMWRKLLKALRGGRCLRVPLRFTGGAVCVESGGVDQGHSLGSPSYSILKECIMPTGDLLLFFPRESEERWKWRWDGLSSVNSWPLAGWRRSMKSYWESQMVTWYRSDLGCLMVYGFWENIPSYSGVLSCFLQLEYKALTS